MPKPVTKGESTLKIGNVELDLKFKTRNLRVLSEILGNQNLFDTLSRFEGDDQTVFSRFADPAFLLPLLAAGCAHQPEFSKDSVPNLVTRLEGLIDQEIEESGKSMFETYARLGAKVMLPFFASISGDQALQDSETMGKLQAEIDAALEVGQAGAS